MYIIPSSSRSSLGGRQINRILNTFLRHPNVTVTWNKLLLSLGDTFSFISNKIFHQSSHALDAIQNPLLDHVVSLKSTSLPGISLTMAPGRSYYRVCQGGQTGKEQESQPEEWAENRSSSKRYITISSRNSPGREN